MYARKTYSRTPDRKTVGGKIDVSREELADFKRKYGADKTLRDLLNYDRTGKLPPEAEVAPKAAAKSESVAQSAGERFAAYERAVSAMPEGTSSAAREALMKSRDAARDAYEKAAEAERAGRSVVKTGAKSDEEKIRETTIRSRAERSERGAMEARDQQRADREEQRRREDLMRPGRDAITPVLGPEMGLAGLGRAALGALGSRVTGMMTRRGESKEAQREAAEKARDEARERMRIDDEPKPSVFRSARPPAPKPTPAPKPEPPKPRVQVEGTKGGVYRSAKDEKPAEPKAEFRSRTADRVDGRGMKRGGTAKAYAKGGSVRGGGCETRSKKTRYV